MRHFLFNGPYSLNGYVEVPEHFPEDYMDKVYNDIEVFGGLTFGGHAFVKDNKIQCLIHEPIYIPMFDNRDYGRTYIDYLNAVNYYKKFIYPDCEYVKVLGFDDNHIAEYGYCNVKEEVVKLAEQIDFLIKENF